MSNMSPVRILLLRRTIIDNSSELLPDWGQLWGQLSQLQFRFTLIISLLYNYCGCRRLHQFGGNLESILLFRLTWATSSPVSSGDSLAKSVTNSSSIFSIEGFSSASSTALRFIAARIAVCYAASVSKSSKSSPSLRLSCLSSSIVEM